MALVHSACNKPGATQVTHRYVRSDHGSVDRGSISNSQADSAGSIPVTRSMLEYRCSRIVFENSRSLPNPCFGPRPGHFGPHLSTPRHSPSASEGRSALTSCRRVFIFISTEYGASETWPPTLDPSCALIGDVRKITGITRMSGRPHIDTSANFPLRGMCAHTCKARRGVFKAGRDPGGRPRTCGRHRPG